MLMRFARGIEEADVRELAIHRRLSRVNYSRRCAEASDVKEYQKLGFSLAQWMEIGYVVKDAAKLEVDAERFDTEYYRKLLDKAWERFPSLCKRTLNWKGSGGIHSIIEFEKK